LFWVKDVFLLFLLFTCFFSSFFVYLWTSKKKIYFACFEFVSLPLSVSTFPSVFSFTVKGVKYCYEIEILDKKVSLRFWISAKLRPKNAKEKMQILSSQFLGSLKAVNPQINPQLIDIDDLNHFFKHSDLKTLKKRNNSFPRIFFENKKMHVAYIYCNISQSKPIKNFTKNLVEACIQLKADSLIHFNFKERKAKNFSDYRRFSDINKSSQPSSIKPFQHNLLSSSFYIILKSENVTALHESLYATRSIISALLNPKKQSEIKIVSKTRKIKNLLKKIFLKDFYISRFFSNKISGLNAKTYLSLPNSPLPGISRFERPKTEIPLNINSSSVPEIILGHIIFNGNTINPVKIKVNDLIHHMVILGLTGYGKTILTASIIEQLAKKTGIKALIIDFKGQEYLGLFPKKVNSKYLLPGSLKFPLGINIFDPPVSVSVEDHAGFILSMIKEIMRAENTFEITPQMFRVLEDILIQFLKLKKDKNFKTFLDTFENYEVLNEFGREKLPAINATLEAIKSRFKRFIIGSLKKIFFVEKTNICWKELLENNIIIDFSLLRTIGVSKTDLQFLLNVILYNIQIEAALRKRSRELKNVIVIEDAEHLIPNLFRKKTTADTLIAEDFAMLMGALQIGLISVSTRPTISDNILANSGTKIFFRTTFDHEKAAKFLNLNLKQKKYLRVMQKREAFCVVPDFPYPFLIKTREFNKNHMSNFTFSLAALDPFTIKSRLSYNPLSTYSPISRSLPKHSLKTEKTKFSFKNLHTIFSQCKKYCLFSFWSKEYCTNSIISISLIVDDYIKDKKIDEIRIKLNDNPLSIYQELSKKAGKSHTNNWTKGLCTFSVLLNKLSSEYPEIKPLITTWLNLAKNHSNTKINNEIKTFYTQLTKNPLGE